MHLHLALAEQGRIAYESGDLKTSRSALERFIEEDQKENKVFQARSPSQRPRVMYYLGWVDATEGKHESASSNFGNVIEILSLIHISEPTRPY